VKPRHPSDLEPAVIRQLVESVMAPVLVVAQALFEGSLQVRAFRLDSASLAGGLSANVLNNLRHRADRTSPCVRDLDRFFAAEVLLNLPVTQSAPVAAPAP
jgi:hypothetical protein